MKEGTVRLFGRKVDSSVYEFEIMLTNYGMEWMGLSFDVSLLFVILRYTAYDLPNFYYPGE